MVRVYGTYRESCRVLVNPLVIGGGIMKIIRRVSLALLILVMACAASQAQQKETFDNEEAIAGWITDK